MNGCGWLSSGAKSILFRDISGYYIRDVGSIRTIMRTDGDRTISPAGGSLGEEVRQDGGQDVRAHVVPLALQDEVPALR